MPVKMKQSKLNLLKFFSEPDYAPVLSGFKERHYPKKHQISTPFDDCDSIFIVKSGRLRIFLSYEDREFTLALLEPGDIFSTHAQAYAETLEESIILNGPTQDFQKRVIAHPEISTTVIKVLGELLKNSISTIESLVFKDVRQRLYEFLSQTAKDRGQQTPQGTLIELGLSTEDIALLIGTSRQTISLLLNELIKSEQMVRLDRHRLVLRDPQQLIGI